MKAVNYGDVVTVVKLDRLARSSRDLQNIWHELDEVGCGFVSLGESWCDTTTDVGRLVMTIMGGIAEFERAKTGSSSLCLRQSAISIQLLRADEYTCWSSILRGPRRFDRGPIASAFTRKDGASMSLGKR